MDRWWGWRIRRTWRWFGARALLCLLVGFALAAAIPTMRAAPAARAAGLASCAVTLTHGVSLATTGGASARLSRTQGVVGTALSLTGSHWPASAAVTVDTYFTIRGYTYEVLARLAQGTTAADGSLKIQRFRAPAIESCILPPDKTGGIVTFLVHTLDDHTQAPVTFTYLTYFGPQITTMPVDEMLAPGAQITMTGAQWEPGEHVTITPAIASWTAPRQSWCPTPQPLTAATVSVTTDSTGAFTASLPTLIEAPETWLSFAVEGAGPRYGDVEVDSECFVMLPKVFPSIHLGASAVNPGGPLAISGDHWLPHQSGVIEYCRGETALHGMVGLRCDPFLAEQLGTFQADGSGHFTAHVHLPANARLGSVTVQARDPSAIFGLAVYAQAQPLAIAPTFAEAHPRQAWLLAHLPSFGVGAGALLALLAVMLLLIRRRRNRARIAA